MTETRISPAPLRTPMFDQSGAMTRPWQVWFGEVFVRAAAEADTEVLDAYSGHGTDLEPSVREAVEVSRDGESGRHDQAIDDNLRLIVQPGTPGEWRERLAHIEGLVSAQREPHSQAEKIADRLESLIASAEHVSRRHCPDAQIIETVHVPAGDDILPVLAWNTGQRPNAKMLVSGPHADRAKHPAGAYEPGTVYYETDRELYYIAVGAVWRYLAGVVRTATIAGKPTDLTAADAGVLWYSEDYRHLWRWTGSGWEYAPGDRRSGEVAYYTEAPGAGWALCNGSSATRTYSDGTTGQVTLPNLIDSYIKGAAAYDAQVHAAAGGTFTGNPLPAHKHATPFVLTGTGRLVWKSWRWGGYSSEWLTGGYQITGGAQNPNGEQLWWDAVSADSAGTPSGTVSPGDVQHVHLMPYFRL